MSPCGAKGYRQKAILYWQRKNEVKQKSLIRVTFGLILLFKRNYILLYAFFNSLTIAVSTQDLPQKVYKI